MIGKKTGGRMAENASNPVIAAADLKKVFRDFWRRPKVRAVDGISFEVSRGEVFGLLGPNGSGKSTTIKMLLGLLFPTSGRLRVLGESPRHVKTRSRVGYLPEHSYIYPHLTSEETLDFYGRLFDLSRRERRRRMEQLLEMIGLQHARHRMVGEFSKGMARRIGLAQALINDPDVVVLDEPTSGLDPIGCRQVKDLILTLARRGKTVLMSSHLLADVEDVCDRIAILYNGKIQAMGPVRELLEEKGRSRITLPELSPEAMARVLELLRKEFGEEPELEHPRRDLEQFFLDVVEKARRGTQASPPKKEKLAGYLEGEDLLQKLAAPSATETKREEPPPSAPPPAARTDARLSHLLQNGPDNE
ncbi:MAG TPA: ABC transporter ATP-binding protein [Kiritimatiellia bacterium]|nr:ABC transporter ATP-binding protein [Kiritimatiellia bacterium]